MQKRDVKLAAEFVFLPADRSAWNESKAKQIAGVVTYQGEIIWCHATTKIKGEKIAELLNKEYGS